MKKMLAAVTLLVFLCCLNGGLSYPTWRLPDAEPHGELQEGPMLLIPPGGISHGIHMKAICY